MHGAAKYIPGIALPEDYARICVHGVRVHGARREFVEDSAAHVWCVFGHLEESPAVECFAEFDNKAEAWTYARELLLAFDWPIWDCNRAEL